MSNVDFEIATEFGEEEVKRIFLMALRECKDDTEAYTNLALDLKEAMPSEDGPMRACYERLIGLVRRKVSYNGDDSILSFEKMLG